MKNNLSNKVKWSKTLISPFTFRRLALWCLRRVRIDLRKTVLQQYNRSEEVHSVDARKYQHNDISLKFLDDTPPEDEIEEVFHVDGEGPDTGNDEVTHKHEWDVVADSSVGLVAFRTHDPKQRIEQFSDGIIAYFPTNDDVPDRQDDSAAGV